jgi:EmrB/QacA subfamily drug resistance transporter
LRLLVAMALASGITSVPNAALVVAIPVLHKQFDASITDLEWTVTGYLLAYATLLIASGRLADQFGRVRLLSVGTLVYVGASVAGALAGTATTLIVALIVVGIGAAVLTPASLAIVTERFRGSQRSLAVAVWAGTGTIVGGLAPAVGGVFTSELSWRWILWLNVIVGLAILVGTRGTEETREPTARKGIDVAGALILVAGLGAITLALNEAPTIWPWGSAQTILTLAVGAVLLAGFILLEHRRREPILDLSIFRRRNVAGASVVVFVITFASISVLFFLPTYLEEIRGDSPLQAGLLVLPATATTTAAMLFGGRLYDRLGPLPPIAGGMALLGAGMLLLSRIDEATRYGSLWWPLALLGFGLGLALTPMNLTALNAVPQARHGVIGGLLATLSGLGGAIGVALSGAVFESREVDRIVDRARQAGIAVSDPTAATLTGLVAQTPKATTALDRFAPADRTTLKRVVTDSFLSALDTAMVLSFAVVTVGIVVALLLIRRREAVPEEEPERPHVAYPIPSLARRP